MHFALAFKPMNYDRRLIRI